MRCNYRCNMWCHCKKPAKPYPPISVESVGIVGWDASGTQTFQAQDNPYYASFSIEVLPADATNKMVTITSSNTRVINWATYDSSDVTFTIEGEGEAEVTITSQSNPEVSTTYSVTVTPATEPFEPNNSMYLIQTRSTKKTRSVGDVDATVRFFAEDEDSTDYVQAQFGSQNKLTYVSYHGACEGNEYCEEIFNNEDIKTELGAAVGGYIAEHGIPAAGVLQFGPEVRDAIEGVFNETGEVSDITTAIEEAQDVVEPSIITITIVHNASNIGYLTDDMGNEIQLPYTFTVPEPVTIDDNLDGGHELSVYGVDSGDDYGSFFPVPNEDGGPEDGGHFTGWACNGLVMRGPVDVYEDTTVVASWQEQEVTGDIQFYATDKYGDPFAIMAPTEEDSSRAIGYAFCKLTDGATKDNVNVYYDGPVQDVQVTFRENLDYDEHVAESESESWEYVIIVDGGWSDIDDAYSGGNAGSIIVELNNEEYATIPLISCKKFLYMTDFDCSTTPTTEFYFSRSDNEEPDGVILNPNGEWGYRGVMTTPTMNWLFEKYVSEGNQMNLSAMIAASMHGDPCGQWNFNPEFIERLGYLMARDTAEERGYMAGFLEHFGENGNLLDGRGGE